VAAIRERSDPSLEALRGGWADTPVPLEAHELALLRAAEQADPSLAELRAGSGELTWFALGAAIVILLIILL
jgi:hypothetical protein